MIKVLNIDDSAFMRKALQIMLESDPEIKVIGSARDGEEGVRKVKELQPDIVTLDIEMPRMGGLEALDLIMKEAPTPVLVVSSITTEGALVTLEALNRGAVDFIPKTQSFVAIDITNIKTDLLEKIKSIARKHRLRRNLIQARTLSRVPLPREQTKAAHPDKPKDEPVFDLSGFSPRMITIGVSTGGPPVVQKLVAALPENFAYPVMVAQHMPQSFTRTFALRLDQTSKVKVVEAENGMEVQKGTVYIGRGGDHLLVQRSGIRHLIKLSKEPAELLYHPSADVLFSSAAAHFGSSNLSLILTGMGKDGLLGLREIHQRGGKILAQNEESCVVYGMPKAAVDDGIANAVLSVDSIIKSVLTLR